MTDNPTKLLNQTILLGDNPDDIKFAVERGHTFIVIGNISLALNLSSQDALDKLAVVTAQAVAHQRAHSLRQVA